MLKQQKQNHNFDVEKFNILRLVHLFAKKGQIQSKTKSKSQLSKSNANLISDLAFSNLQNIHKNKFQAISKGANYIQKGVQLMKIVRGQQVSYKCIEFLEKFPTILPFNKLKIIWDGLLILAFMFCLWIYPLDLILGKNDMKEKYNITWQAFNLFNLVVNLMDMFLRFITAYYDKAVCITDKQQITQNYLQGYFLFDLISCVPFIFELSTLQWYFKFWNFLVFLRIPSFWRIVTNINDIVLSKKYLSNIFSLIKLLIYVVFVAHIFGIIWLGQAFLFYNNEYVQQNWIYAQGLEGESLFQQYTWTLYFAVTTMTTVGYGDITPQNEYEAGILILGLVIATGLFAFTFNSIGYIIDDLTKDAKEFNKQASLVNIYLEKKNSPPHLKLQIQKYLEYQFQTEKKLSNEEEDMVISKLPENMQNQIQFEQAMFIIQKNQHLFGKFSLKIQKRLALQLIERKFHKNETVFTPGSIEEDPCYYFIVSGKVEIYTTSYKGDQQFTTLGILSKHQNFGDQSFITGEQRSTGAQTLTPCVISYIKKSSFLDIISKSFTDYEIYCMLRDRITYNQSYYLLGNFCIGCQGVNHLVKDCPLLHYKPNIEQLILKQKFEEFQPRKKKFFRLDYIKYSSLGDLMLLQQRGEQYFSEMRKIFPQEELLKKNNVYKLTQNFLKNMKYSTLPQNASVEKQNQVNQNPNLPSIKELNEDNDQQSINNNRMAYNQSKNRNNMKISERNLSIFNLILKEKQQYQQMEQEQIREKKFNEFLMDFDQKLQDLNDVTSSSESEYDSFSEYEEDGIEQKPSPFKKNKYISDNQNRQVALAKYKQRSSIQNQNLQGLNLMNKKKQNVQSQEEIQNQMEKKDSVASSQDISFSKIKINKKQIKLPSIAVNNQQKERKGMAKFSKNVNQSLHKNQHFWQQQKQNKIVKVQDFGLNNLDKKQSKNLQKILKNKRIIFQNKQIDDKPKYSEHFEQEFLSQCSSQDNNKEDENQLNLSVDINRRGDNKKRSGYIKQQNWQTSDRMKNMNINFTSNNDSENQKQNQFNKYKQKSSSMENIFKSINLSNQIKNRENIAVEYDQDDCQIRNFDQFYPAFNFNCERIVQKHNWIKDNFTFAPEFGTYTLQQRKIRLKFYMNFEQYLMENQQGVLTEECEQENNEIILNQNQKILLQQKQKLNKNLGLGVQNNLKSI